MSTFEDYQKVSKNYDDERSAMGADVMAGLLHVHGGKPLKVSNGAKIRNRYKQVPHLTQDTNGKVTNSQLDTTNESQELSPFPAGDHKAHINRRAQRHSKHKTEKKHIKDPQKKYRLGTVSKIFNWRA